MSRCLGIDIGGSGIKAGVVDVKTGTLQSERVRVETPPPASPDTVVEAVRRVADGLGITDPVGVGFPSIVDGTGVVRSAMNIHSTWVGVDVHAALEGALGTSVAVINDADAAAIGESEFGAAKGRSGLVVVLTFGTGIGSGLLFDGSLIRNVELGVLELDGASPAESRFSAKARRREDLDWEEWGERTARYIGHVHRLLSPELIVLGGGVVKHWEEYSGLFPAEVPVVPATLGNDAGLIGAASYAYSTTKPTN